MAFVDVGVGFVRSLVVWLEANRVPAPTALWSLYLRLKAAPKSVTPIAITISKGNETANSRISDPSVPAHASTHLSHAFLSESVMPFTLLPRVTSVLSSVFVLQLSNQPHRNRRYSCSRDRSTGVAGITPGDVQHYCGNLPC